MNSHLAQISTPGVSRSNECRRTIGVSPMRSVIFSATRRRARRMTSASLLHHRRCRSPAPRGSPPSSGSRRWRIAARTVAVASRTITCSASAAASVPASTAAAPLGRRRRGLARRRPAARRAPARVAGTTTRSTASGVRAHDDHRQAQRAAAAPASASSSKPGAHDEVERLRQRRSTPSACRASLGRGRRAITCADAGRAQVARRRLGGEVVADHRDARGAQIRSCPSGPTSGSAIWRA